MIHFLSRDTKKKQCLCFLVNSVKLEAKFISIYINGNIENLKGYTSTASQDKRAQVWAQVCWSSRVPR